MSLQSEVAGLRDRAQQLVPARRDNRELYHLLSGCLHLCETADLGELQQLYLNQPLPDGRNRRYFEQDADAPLVVCRLVFEGDRRRDACWRYTAVLREAQKLQLRGETLMPWLLEHGGLQALFLSRSVEARTKQTKTLHLNKSVTCSKTAPFTLRLQYDGRGRFNVLEESS